MESVDSEKPLNLISTGTVVGEKKTHKHQLIALDEEAATGVVP